MSDNRSTWTSRIGFILASAGAAIGLGAIWKFPYLAGTNGGSVFMFPYIVLSFTIGLVLLIAEVGLGRTGKGCIVTAYRAIAGKNWTIWGYLGVLTGFMVLCFYSTIGGWTLSYLIDSAVGRGLVSNQDELSALFGGLVSDPVKSLGFQALFLFLTGWVVAYEISRGIEKISKVLMPLLLVLVIIVIVRGVTLPGASEGLAYLFSWNPEAFSWKSLLAAMGFTFFSLCIGCGCMLTYGSYLSQDSNLINGCAWITFLATAASILGGHAGGLCIPSRSVRRSRPHLHDDAGRLRAASLRTALCVCLLSVPGRGGHHQFRIASRTRGCFPCRRTQNAPHDGFSGELHRDACGRVTLHPFFRTSG